MGWLKPYFLVNFLDKKIYKEDFSKNYFCNGFGQNLYLRKSCYSCNYKLNTDILIGDFWGIENSNPEIENKDGISLFFINTKRKNFF